MLFAFFFQSTSHFLFFLQSSFATLSRDKMSAPPSLKEIIHDDPKGSSRGLEESNEIQTLDDLLAASGTGGDAQTVSSVVVMPPAGTYDNPGIMKQLRNIQLLSTFANAYGMKLLYDDRKDMPFDFGNAEEKGEFTRCAANKIHYVITKLMATFLPLTEAQDMEMEQDFNQRTFHNDFLTQLFGSFSFGKETTKQLDQVLTSVFKNLSGIKSSESSEKATLDHLVYMYYFENVPGLEEEKIKVAKLRLFYLTIDAKSWHHIVKTGKNSTAENEGFKFKMTYHDFKFNMNEEQVENNRPGIENAIKKVSDKNFEDISRLYTPAVVKDDK